MSWPVRLGTTLPDGGVLGMREMRRGDKREFLAVRRANQDWLGPWDPTNPDGPPLTLPFETLLRQQRREIRAGTLRSWLVTVDGEIAGQLNLMNIERRAFRSCVAGYWVAQHVAGRGVAPHALALAGDFALGELGLHRLAVFIRPENAASLAVVRKLGLREEGVLVRYLHIAGAWRDHRAFAVTQEELEPEGLLGRLAGHQFG